MGICPAAALALWSWASPALGYDVALTSTTAAQGYSLRSPWGEPVLTRRRFLQTLGMQVTNIAGDSYDDDAVHVTVRVRMRLDADFGLEGYETDPAASTPGFIPGLQQAPVDLMYGYVDIDNLAQGLLSLRLGRQYVIDPLGWWSFDGALMRVELPVYVAFETYGGFEQRGGFPLSTPRFEREGVWRGDRQGLDANLYPSFLSAELGPAYGANVETWGLPVVHARFGYRRVWNTGQVTTSPFPSSTTALPPTTQGMRMSSERVAASLDLLEDKLGTLRAGAVYDLYASRWTSSYAAADVFASDALTLGADVDRVVPSFDADAIWTWFSPEPATTALARAEYDLTRKVQLGGSAGFRWTEATVNDEPAATTLEATDVLARVAVRYRSRDSVLGASGTLDDGDLGRREGLDLYGQHMFERRYVASARVSVYDWKDDWRPDRSATSFGYVLGGGYRIDDLTRVLVEWEHDTNRLVGQRYRVLAMLELLVSP